MTIATYADLQAAVKDWANRMDSSVSGRVNDFIRLGEDRIWMTGDRVVRSQWQILPTTLTIPANQNWVALPTDWLGFQRVRSAAEPRIEYESPERLEDRQFSGTGDATKYSVEGGRLLYGQISTTAAQVLNVWYFQDPGRLGSAAAPSATWLLTKAPSIYLYAALLEAAIYVKKADRIGEFGTLLDKAISAFMGKDEADRLRGGRWRYQRHG